MTEPFKILFDECLGKPIADALSDFLQKSGHKPTVKHVLDFQIEGIHDVDWLPKIAAERFVVISADRGKRNKNERQDEKLPFLCRKHRVTLIMMSAAVHSMKSFDKAMAIATVWPDIVCKCTEAPRGTRFSLRKFDKSFAIVNADVEAGEQRRKRSDRPGVQREMFTEGDK